MRYNDSINPEDRNKSHTRIMNLVGDNSIVLDVGCSTGFLGEYLIREKGCRVDGIESDEEMAEVAARRLTSLVKGDVEDTGLWSGLNGRKYDAIIAGDIIEHLKDPVGFLKRLAGYLSSGGRIILSLPNIAHFRIRLKLLTGKFEYEEAGIMDSTHLRFFTYDTARRLIRGAGYDIVHEEHTLGPRVGRFPVLERILPAKIFAAQFIFVIRPADA